MTDPWEEPYGMIDGKWVPPPCGCPVDRDCSQCHEGTAGWPPWSSMLKRLDQAKQSDSREAADSLRTTAPTDTNDQGN